tara:strand:+ start:305 stop:2254 length:1950 start_codon:yes stop_codon:yes gene_type:complete
MAYGNTSQGEAQGEAGGTESTVVNPIVEVNLQATADDRFFFQSNVEEQYIGPYHRHEDGTLMIGVGVLGIGHELKPDEIIFKKIGDEDIKETRERVSDIFYKLWFQSNTLSDSELLSLQTTIRDGIKQTGRGEDEPLVFYKKDRNTLESRKDLQGDTFEQICQYIFDNNIINLEGLFYLESVPGPITDGQEVTKYKINFVHGTVGYQIEIANKVGDTFTDVLNLSQLTKPKTASRINPEKAREVLDTNIFELLPNQTTRQDTINSFFNQFNELIGPKPAFDDVDGDGVGEVATNFESDEQSRISYENQRNAYITRLDNQAEGNTNNQGKTLESMRNKLNTYLGDVDNVIDTLEDTRPEYENISEGFLRIRKPNQAIILRSPNNNELEFQKINPDTGKPSFLEDGFTITMWVKFLSKTSEGTLFNFGNPLNSNSQESGDSYGFRLDTKVNEYEGKNYRYIRLVVRDWTNTTMSGGNRMYRIRDNNFGTQGINRFDHRSFGTNVTSQPQIHKAFPQISTDDLDEWYFICATFNPNIVEPDYNDTLPMFRQNTQYWLNHMTRIDGQILPQIVSNSGEGAKCKVEIISRSELLNARGYIGKPLTVSSKLEDSIDIQSDSINIQSSFTYEIINNQENNETTVNLPTSSFQYQIV